MKHTKMHQRIADTQRNSLRQLQSLSWDDLRIFWAICEKGGMRQAGQLLCMNASTVSRRVSTLEQVLGTQLLERHPRGILLTAAGEEVRAFSYRMHEEVEQLKTEVAGRDQDVQGCVRISAAEAVSPLVSRALPELLENYPSLELELIASDMMSDLGRHEAEIAIRVADEPPEHLIGTRLGRCQVGIFAAKEYLQNFEKAFDDESHRWVAWPTYVNKKPAFRWVDRHCPNRRTVVRANSASSVLQAVRMGLGLAPLALSQAAFEPSLVLLKRLPEDCATSAWLLTHGEMRKSARVRAVLSHLDASLRLALREAQQES